MDGFYPALELSRPVHVMVPGQTEPQTFTARLALHVYEREPTPEEWREIIRATLVGWSDVVNEAGEPVAYSEEAKAPRSSRGVTEEEPRGDRRRGRGSG
jgi:hypothetical protein